MPVTVKSVGGKIRVVEADGKIATNAAGTPVDGGGHDTADKAQAQARAINASLSDKEKPNGKDGCGPTC